MSPDNIIPFPIETSRKRVPIDFTDLEMAMEDWNLDHFSYLDSETGEVIFYSEFDPDEETEELKEQIDADESGRYVDIPRADSGEDFRDMLDWAASLEDGPLHDELWDALDRSHPFRRFREIMEDYPTEQQQWNLFKRTRILQRALEWLESEKIEASPLLNPPKT